jgi:phage baseplate assembly protein W
VIGISATTGTPLGGAEHLRQSIADILGTPLGTRLARRDYGSLLPELLDQPVNAATRLRLYAATALALLRHEPRIRVSRIGFEIGVAAGTARLTITARRTDVAAAAAPFTVTVPARGMAALSA